MLCGASGVLGSPSLIAVQSELYSPTVQSTLEYFGFERRFYNPFTRTLRRTPFGFANFEHSFRSRYEFCDETACQSSVAQGGWEGALAQPRFCFGEPFGSGFLVRAWLEMS
jgi:hypothetical protein